MCTHTHTTNIDILYFYFLHLREKKYPTYAWKKCHFIGMKKNMYFSLQLCVLHSEGTIFIKIVFFLIWYFRTDRQFVEIMTYFVISHDQMSMVHFYNLFNRFLFLLSNFIRWKSTWQQCQCIIKFNLSRVCWFLKQLMKWLHWHLYLNWQTKQIFSFETISILQPIQSQNHKTIGKHIHMDKYTYKYKFNEVIFFFTTENKTVFCFASIKWFVFDWMCLSVCVNFHDLLSFKHRKNNKVKKNIIKLPTTSTFVDNWTWHMLVYYHTNKCKRTEKFKRNNNENIQIISFSLSLFSLISTIIYFISIVHNERVRASLIHKISAIYRQTKEKQLRFDAQPFVDTTVESNSLDICCMFSVHLHLHTLNENGRYLDGNGKKKT